MILARVRDEPSDKGGSLLEGRGFFPGRSRRNRLRRTHLNGNPGFRNAFLMRLRRGRLCLPPAVARPRHRLPSLWTGSDHLRRPLVRFRPSAHDSPRKSCASLRAAQIIATKIMTTRCRHFVRSLPQQHSTHAGPQLGECNARSTVGWEGGDHLDHPHDASGLPPMKLRTKVRSLTVRQLFTSSSSGGIGNSGNRTRNAGNSIVRRQRSYANRGLRFRR